MDRTRVEELSRVKPLAGRSRLSTADEHRSQSARSVARARLYIRLARVKMSLPCAHAAVRRGPKIIDRFRGAL